MFQVDPPTPEQEAAAEREHLRRRQEHANTMSEAQPIVQDIRAKLRMLVALGACNEHVTKSLKQMALFEDYIEFQRAAPPPSRSGR